MGPGTRSRDMSLLSVLGSEEPASQHGVRAPSSDAWLWTWRPAADTITPCACRLCHRLSLRGRADVTAAAAKMASGYQPVAISDKAKGRACGMKPHPLLGLSTCVQLVPYITVPYVGLLRYACGPACGHRGKRDPASITPSTHTVFAQCFPCAFHTHTHTHAHALARAVHAGTFLGVPDMPLLGLGLAALGRPGYINLGHGADLSGASLRAYRH